MMKCSVLWFSLKFRDSCWDVIFEVFRYLIEDFSLRVVLLCQRLLPPFPILPVSVTMPPAWHFLGLCDPFFQDAPSPELSWDMCCCSRTPVASPALFFPNSSLRARHFESFKMNIASNPCLDSWCHSWVRSSHLRDEVLNFHFLSIHEFHLRSLQDDLALIRPWTKVEKSPPGSLEPPHWLEKRPRRQWLRRLHDEQGRCDSCSRCMLVFGATIRAKTKEVVLSPGPSHCVAVHSLSPLSATCLVCSLIWRLAAVQLLLPVRVQCKLMQFCTF